VGIAACLAVGAASLWLFGRRGRAPSAEPSHAAALASAAQVVQDPPPASSTPALPDAPPSDPTPVVAAPDPTTASPTSAAPSASVAAKPATGVSRPRTAPRGTRVGDAAPASPSGCGKFLKRCK
jgi:hypothetical protein